MSKALCAVEAYQAAVVLRGEGSGVAPLEWFRSSTAVKAG
jgi:hypothetical protein